MPSLRPHVCIILPDREGAARELGQALADRLVNVTLGASPDPAAVINYFLDPAMRTQKGSTLELGWVTDLTQARLTRDMDQVVTPTQALCDGLQAQGVTKVTVITRGGTPPDWEACAQAHQKLFRDLADKAQTPVQAGLDRAGEKAPFEQPVRLLLHGNESRSLGGPTVRVPRTAAALSSLGVPAQATVFDGLAGTIDEKVVHLFNVWPPESALHALHSLKAAGKTVIFSPIYLDLGERDFWQGELPQLGNADPAHIAERYDAYRAHAATRGRLSEIIPGYHAMLREMLALADHVIFLSTAERDALARIGAQVAPDQSSLILNPVDPDIWAQGDPELFRRTYLDGLPGPQDYIICVGRIEERKNQLMLARALRDLPVRLVLLGHQGSPEYAAEIRRIAGPDTLMLGRIDPGSEMLRSALTGARAFALPSWAEGASLAALEAAACGTDLMLSTRSSEKAYFGDLAQYCDPADFPGMRTTVQRMLKQGGDTDRRAALQAHMRRHNSWSRHGAETAAAYAKAVETHETKAAPQKTAPRAMQHLVLDITPCDSARISERVLIGLAQALRDTDTPPDLIFWHPAREAFAQVPARFGDMDQALRYCRTIGAGAPYVPVDLPPDTALITLGEAWRDNHAYLNALEDLKVRTDCSLLALVQDLAPLEVPYLYDAAEAAAFRAGLLRLAGLVDCFVGTAPPLVDALVQVLGSARLPPVEMAQLPAAGPAALEKLSDGPLQARFAEHRFVLVTGDVDPQSNHEMLCRVWAGLAGGDGAADLHLVIACPSGRASAALADRIARDPQVRDMIHLVTDPGAMDLSWLYDACLFTVLPSERAYGIVPVLESLAHGRACLVSSTLEVPETVLKTAANLLDRLAPGDVVRWTDCIAQQACEGAENHGGQGDGACTLQTFAQIGETLSAMALTPRRLRRFRRIYPGEVLGAGAGAAPLSIRFGPGWHPAQAGVRWAGAPTVGLTFKAHGLKRRGVLRLQVLLRLRAHIPDAEMLEMRITSGEVTVFKAHVEATTFPEEVLVTIPATALDAHGVFDLHLHLRPSVTRQDKAEEEGQAAHQERLVGIGLVSAVLLDGALANPLLYLSCPHHWSAGDFTLTADMSDPAHRAVIAPGLDFSPAWGVGAPGGQISLRIPVLPGAGRHALSVTVRPVASSRHPVTARLVWNGRRLGERSWRDDMPDTFTLPLTADDMDISGPAILTLQSGSVLTPAELAIGTSTRHAGMGVMDIVLVPEKDGP